VTASSEQSIERPTPAGLRCEHFTPLLEQAFTLHLPDGKSLQLRLVEATSARHTPPSGMRLPFSLLFRCPELPAGQYILQGSYPIEHPALGRLDLFMTPIQPDQAGMRYECIFA
jgi:hypothetical protein